MASVERIPHKARSCEFLLQFIDLKESLFYYTILKALKQNQKVLPRHHINSSQNQYILRHKDKYLNQQISCFIKSSRMEFPYAIYFKGALLFYHYYIQHLFRIIIIIVTRRHFINFLLPPLRHGNMSHEW